MPDDEAPHATYSLVVRVQRTTVESAHVSVLVTGDLITDDHLDGKKAFAAAVELAKSQPQTWVRDAEPEVIVHPWQTPPPGYSGK